MRWLALLVALGGCETLFPLEGPSTRNGHVELRGTFAGSTPNSTTVSIPRAPDVADDDVAIAIVEAPYFSTLATPDWTTLTELHSTSCSGGVQGFFLVREIGDLPELVFSLVAPGKISVLVTIYDEAAMPTLIAQSQLFTESSPGTLALDAVSADPDSIVWIGGVANRPWGPASGGVVKQDALQNAAVYDTRIGDDGLAPAFEVEWPMATCVETLEVRFEGAVL